MFLSSDHAETQSHGALPAYEPGPLLQFLKERYDMTESKTRCWFAVVRLRVFR
jgi:hypothetical protein